MIRKSTLIILLVTVVLGSAVYYFDWKRGEKEAAKPTDESKLAFWIQAADIASVKISHPSKPSLPATVLEKHDGAWAIVQPISTDADATVAESIATDIAAARVSGKEPGTPDRIKAFNLDPGQLELDFQLQNGTKHTIRFGDRDFNGTGSYSIVDSGKEVALLPYSLLQIADKSFEEIRDHSALHISGNEVASFTLKNLAGEVAATKDKDAWKFTKPAGKLGDSTDILSLLNTVSVAKMTISSETPDNLAKYGLSSPAIAFSATDTKGKTSKLLIGRKIDNEYFARDATRPLVFRVKEDLYKKLTEGYANLRDKKIVHFDPHDVNRIEVHNSNGTALFTRKAAKNKDEDWVVETPDDLKGKTVGSWKFFTPIVDERADSVLDSAPFKIASAVGKPAITVTLSTVDNKKLTLNFSAVTDDAVYAKTSDDPAVFKLNKKIFETLDFKTKDIVF